MKNTVRIQVISNAKLVQLIDETAESMGLNRSALCNMLIYNGLSEYLGQNIKSILERM